MTKTPHSRVAGCGEKGLGAFYSLPNMSITEKFIGHFSIFCPIYLLRKKYFANLENGRAFQELRLCGALMFRQMKVHFLARLGHLAQRPQRSPSRWDPGFFGKEGSTIGAMSVCTVLLSILLDATNCF
jgi:hypothetical protein